MPAQLVWISAELERTTEAEEFVEVGNRIANLIATSKFVESFYLADVAKLLLHSRRYVLQKSSGFTGQKFQLPGLAFGDSPPPAVAALKYDSLAMSEVSVRPESDEEGSEAFDALSFVVYAVRAAAVHARFNLAAMPPGILEFGSADVEKSAEAALNGVIVAFAAQCQFKQTGDGYLHAVLQLRLPSWPFSSQISGASPFKTASRLLGEGTNDAVRPLIEAGVEPFLQGLQDPAALTVNQSAAECFAVVACLVDEMCGKRTLLVNDQIALCPPDVGEPRLFVNGDFGCLPPHSFGVVDGPRIWIAERPLQAAAAVLARSSPTTLQARLWEVISAPEGTDLPGNPFSKYLR